WNRHHCRHRRTGTQGRTERISSARLVPGSDRHTSSVSRPPLRSASASGFCQSCLCCTVVVQRPGFFTEEDRGTVIEASKLSVSLKWRELSRLSKFYLLAVYLAAIPSAYVCLSLPGRFSLPWLFLTLPSLFVASVNLRLPKSETVVISMSD